MDDETFDPCETCPSTPADPALLSAHLDAGTLATLSPETASALAACARCLALSGGHIDRVHVEAALATLGRSCFVLSPRYAAEARRARPDLAADAVLVIEADASIWDPRVGLRERIDSLLSLKAPDVVIAPLQEELAARIDEPFHAEWHRVWAWPPPRGVADASIAAAEITKSTASAALPLFGRASALPAITYAADHSALDAAGWAMRETLATDAGSDPGARLALRYLDELGCTDRRDDQDTALDAAYFSLLRGGHARGGDVCRHWLEEAFVTGWLAVTRR